MRGCDDGYPSCRNAEAGAGWCKSQCVSALQVEIAAEQKKSANLTEQYIKFTTTQGHSRARTTTYNANTGRIAERVKFLRVALKQATA